jgi:hypothetical protein
MFRYSRDRRDRQEKLLSNARPQAGIGFLGKKRSFFPIAVTSPKVISHACICSFHLFN